MKKSDEGYKSKLRISQLAHGSRLEKWNEDILTLGLEILNSLPLSAGMTAIHLASMGGHVSSMEALVPTCDILSVTSEGMSALHLAAEYGNLGAVQWLRLQGLDASLRDNKGWTPRQYAKDEGQKKVVEFLEKLEKQHSPQGLTQVCIRFCVTYHCVTYHYSAYSVRHTLL